MQNRVSKPLTPLAEVDRHGVIASRGRKMAPTGGNRSWSEEEENYLLQTRMQKMPYKHIAAHLKKTELACRLHYHQLSHGSHRRKRTASLSSASSGGSSLRHSPPQYHLSGEQHLDYGGNPISMHTSPNNYGSMNQVMPYTSNNASPNRTHHKLLLPKPRPITPDDSPNRLHGLRINTSGSSPQSSVDTDRLRQIYDNHRNSFWGAIASEYGANASPGQLEEIWRQGQDNRGMHPPTPEDSPDGRAAAHPMLQPSPFPNYATNMHQARKDYGPMHLPSNGPSPADRYTYSMPTPNLSSYASTPVLGGLSRSSTWSTNMNGPPTAISSLLTEDRCPRHPQDRYAVASH